MSDAEDIWRQKSDEEIADRAKHLADYTPEGQRMLRAELRRRGLVAPPDDEGQPPDDEGQPPDLYSREWATRVNDKLEALERRLPNSNIIHPGFWRRAFAVWGHQLAAVLLLYAAFLGIFTPSGEVELTPEQLRSLRALGYIR